MSAGLYEALGVPKDATTDQIRKAYKKQALKTHPDKLQPDLSDEEKALAAEKFKQISHACEILTDPEKRKQYDIHGVWPPPEADSDDDFEMFFEGMSGPNTGRHGRGFSSPFFSAHTQHPRSSFVFRDPFELFNSIFQDFEDIFRPQPAPSFAPFNPLIGQRSMGLFHDPLFGPALPSLSLTPMSMNPIGFGMNDALPGRGHSYQSESFVSRTVNGVTESTHTRRDQEGNEYVTRKYPDGREVYTINGVEQMEPGRIRGNPESRQLPSTQPRHRTTLPLYLQNRPSHHQRATAATYHPSRHAVPATPETRYRSPPPSYRSNSTKHHGSYPRTSEHYNNHDRERRGSSTHNDIDTPGDDQYYRRPQRSFTRG